MNVPKRWVGLCAATLAMAAVPALAQNDNPLRQSPPGDAQQNQQPNAQAGAQAQGDTEILTRGPVHEAFAQSSQAGLEAEPAVPKQAPDPIDETPPDVKPEGDNVVWIPGYWDWDDTRNDFIWVSGLWRDVPPGQRWVPGYWTDANNGSQWVPGFWTTTDTQEVQYLPEPPASQEHGPNVEAPGDDYFWVPGNWVYQQNDYAWQPGYWAASQPNWVWTPARYSWTPNGYVYTAGYWDYPPMARGTLFAPAYFPGYRVGSYTPSYALATSRLLISLFVRPGYGSYYFGNYYGNNFSGMGFYPWIAAPSYMQGYYYDPLWSYYRYGAGGNMFNNLYGWNRYYAMNPTYRPPATLAATQQLAANMQNANQAVVQQAVLAADVNKIIGNDQMSNQFGRLQKLSDDQRQQLTNQVKGFRDLQQARLAGKANLQGNAQTRTTLKLPGADVNAEGSLQDNLRQRGQDRLNAQDKAGAEARAQGKLPQPPASQGREDGLRNALRENAPLDDEARQKVEESRQQLEQRIRSNRENSGQLRNGEQRPNVGPGDRGPGDRPNAEPGNRNMPNRPNVEPGNRPNVEPGNRPNVEPGNRPNVEPGNRPNPGGNRPNVEPGNRPNPGGNRPKVEPGNRPNPGGNRPNVEPGNRPNPGGNAPGLGGNRPNVNPGNRGGGNRPGPGVGGNRGGNSPGPANRGGGGGGRPNRGRN